MEVLFYQYRKSICASSSNSSSKALIKGKSYFMCMRYHKSVKSIGGRNVVKFNADKTVASGAAARNQMNPKSSWSCERYRLLVRKIDLGVTHRLAGRHTPTYTHTHTGVHPQND